MHYALRKCMFRSENRRAFLAGDAAVGVGYGTTAATGSALGTSESLPFT